MNIPNLLRSMVKSSTLFKNHRHLPRYMKQLNLCKMSVSSNASQLITQKTKESFEDALPSIMDTITTNTQFADVPEVGNWVKKTLDYNLGGGKKTRGMTTLLAYEKFEKPGNVTDETIHSAKMLGWCVEMLQAYLLILDDIMDSSSTRRGMPCWYRLPDVGTRAINDAILIYSSMFHVIKTQFGGEKFYTKILELFNETLFQTSIGQHLDLTMANRHKNDYSLFTIEQYNAIVKYKTAYYTFKLPVCLGLLLANNTDPAKHKKVEDICLDIGRFFQIQDDYIDCYGDESVSGKKGTDIQAGKCSWFAVQALQQCDANQRTVFSACYGSQEPAHIERIKILYRQLQLPELYAETEAKMYEALISQARAMPEDLSPTLFIKLIDMLNKRSY
ncbi:uncharacterized protein LOC133527492 isoform X1 [Cydia pomonella]|uniref:uncharacterized protein LOC133527492 isoform X1 n=2 Tax=Cydia pomonella TaxID=82600 RepID=UPI002ADD51A3|nr:uncharacterized protein LOC133527492 isoform X1 [Cydia pomonella]XP_061720505.1 uncharacterized protein LOC133527492 isoform X1 [Cydia pomonella]